jgi:hypothetical protein
MDASTAIRVEDLTTIAIAQRVRRKTLCEQMLAGALHQGNDAGVVGIWL